MRCARHLMFFPCSIWNILIFVPAIACNYEEPISIQDSKNSIIEKVESDGNTQEPSEPEGVSSEPDSENSETNEETDTNEETNTNEETDTNEQPTEPIDTSDLGSETNNPDDSGEIIQPIVPTYPSNRVGIFYLAWHAYAAQAIDTLFSSQRLVVEDVIRDPSLHFSNMLDDFGLYNQASGFHYHAKPQAGFYCLYRKRSSENSGVLDDCSNISQTAETHASLLWDAGVDFVFVDLTNLSTMSPFADALGLRPFEVLVEEWYLLRQNGIPTPQIAAWVQATTEPDALTTHLLNTYNHPDYQDVILTHQSTGQKVMFIVGGTFQSGTPQMNELSANNILPVPMWGNLSEVDLQSGIAGWMQPCTENSAFTTLIKPTTPCNQFYTTNSPLGTVLSVSASYQIGYASLPMQASGRYGGLTFQKQFETALSVRPDYLLINAWNEHIAQPQSNPYDPNLDGLQRSMGMNTPSGNGSADWLWVDLYGTDLSRDIEPTVQGGTAAYDLMVSCLTVYENSGTCSDPTWHNETCCQLEEGMNLVRSFANGGSSWDYDHVLTIDGNEIPSLQNSGWTELCNPHYGPPSLCGGTNGDGPFLLFPSAGTNRVPIYRCYTGVNHFFSTSSSCEGTTVESLLGYASSQRTSETPRPLRRCFNPSQNVHFHWLNENCPQDASINEEGILGYVK